MIPLVRPDIGEEEISAVTDILRSGMLAQGPKVAELEAHWAEYVGVRHAIAVTNGTVALMVIYAGMGLGPGDEVITVSHSFNATASAILSTGATPVFVDIEPDTYVIDADRIEAAITPRTQGDLPGPPVRPAGRHGRDHRDRRAARARDRRGRLPGARRIVRRPARRQLRARGLQPLRDEEHDDRRGRPDHHERRSPGRLDPRSTGTRACASVTTTKRSATTSG